MLDGSSFGPGVAPTDACTGVAADRSIWTFDPWNSSMQPPSKSKAIAVVRTVPGRMLASGRTRSLERARRCKLERDERAPIVARGLVCEAHEPHHRRRVVL